MYRRRQDHQPRCYILPLKPLPDDHRGIWRGYLDNWVLQVVPQWIGTTIQAFSLHSRSPRIHRMQRARSHVRGAHIAWRSVISCHRVSVSWSERQSDVQVVKISFGSLKLTTSYCKLYHQPPNRLFEHEVISAYKHQLLVSCTISTSIPRKDTCCTNRCSHIAVSPSSARVPFLSSQQFRPVLAKSGLFRASSALLYLENRINSFGFESHTSGHSDHVP